MSGAVQLDLSQVDNSTGATMFSCDGVEGTLDLRPGRLDVEGVEITMEPAEVNMSGGRGPGHLGAKVTLPGAGGAGFTDTVKLRITGTADAPALEAAGVHVEATGALAGRSIDLAQFFPEEGGHTDRRRRPQC